MKRIACEKEGRTLREEKRINDALGTEELELMNQAFQKGAEEIHVKKTPKGMKMISIRGKVLRPQGNPNRK